MEELSQRAYSRGKNSSIEHSRGKNSSYRAFAVEELSQRPFTVQELFQKALAVAEFTLPGFNTLDENSVQRTPPSLKIIQLFIYTAPLSAIARLLVNITAKRGK